MRTHACRKRGRGASRLPSPRHDQCWHHLIASLGPGRHGSGLNYLGPCPRNALCLGFLLLNGMLSIVAVLGL